MKNFLLCLAFFVLFILLLLPPGLRIFGKDLYKEKKITKPIDEVEMLSCTKINETISTSFLNGKAYNIKYSISGNHTVEEETMLPDEEEIEEEEILTSPKNDFIEDFKKYAQIKYKENENLTEYVISVNLLDFIPEELQNHTKTIEEVSSYYREHSFSCTTQKY